MSNNPAICKPEISIQLTLSDHHKTLLILNIHAGVLASNQKTGSPKFYHLFNNFVRLFTVSGMGCDEGYLAGDPTEVTDAYWAFMACLETEVTPVAQESDTLVSGVSLETDTRA